MVTGNSCTALYDQVMNRRQSKRQAARRAHHAASREPDRPPLILERDSFPPVKSAHIVPRMYQRAWAVDGQVAVHVGGKDACIKMSTRKAGTRPWYYRRTRPNGEEVDDIEASLAYVEDKATQPLRELIAGEPITYERKGGVAQLLRRQRIVRTRRRLGASPALQARCCSPGPGRLAR